MKAVILLAALAVVAARPEAPLHGGYHASSAHRRTNGFQSASAAAFITGNGRNGGRLSQQYGPPTNGNGQNGASGHDGDNGMQNEEDLTDFTPPAANGAPAPQYGPPAATNGHRNGNGNGHANGNGHRNGNGRVNGNGVVNGNGYSNGNGHRNGNGHVNGNGKNGNGHAIGNGHRNGNGHVNGYAHANGNGNGKNGNGAPAAKYGPPGFENGTPVGATEDPLAVPASYKFAYKVLDEEAGLDFGHEESREGDEAMGEYRVLLPDGRTQIVTYVANNDGYQPEIRYEEPKEDYPRGPNGNGSY